MTLGVGGSNWDEQLAKLADRTGGVPPIDTSEFAARLAALQQRMIDAGVAATYLHAGTNLYYFTGLRWNPSERMVAAIVFADGDLCYIAPKFEIDTIRDYWLIESDLHTWEEHESPYKLLSGLLRDRQAESAEVWIDEVTPFFIVSRIQAACPDANLTLAQAATQALRSVKSPAELALIKRAHEMTLEVIQAASAMLRPGISTSEVVRFIDEAHQKVGAPAGSYFCIVLFGVSTSFPHGVKDPQILQPNDWVLIDTGCQLHGYMSDITRSFSFGEPTEEQRAAFAAEQRAQLAAFSAAQVNASCEMPDHAARASLIESGFGPDYALPGLPHRTGHGCGLDIHEGPYLVRGETAKMQPGMVFSNEPMLVIPDKFGVRLEDHFYVTESGPRWFTQPSPSVDDPFDLGS